MTSSEQLLPKDLICPICLQLFLEPVTLPCGHNYCKSCIQTAIGFANGKHHCPECRHEYGGVEVLQKNLKLCGIVNSYMSTTRMARPGGSVLCDHCLTNKTPAVKTCLQCESSMCSDHLHWHINKKTFKHHMVVEPLPDPGSQKCLLHNKELEFFCVSDASFLCGTCFIEGSHLNHDIQGFESAEVEIRRILETQVKMAKSKFHMISSLLHTSLEDEKIFTASSDKLAVTAMSLLDSMLNQVNSYKSRLSHELQKEVEDKQESWRSNISQTTRQQDLLKDFQEQATSVLAETDQSIFIRRFLRIKSHLKEAIEGDVIVPKLPNVDIKKLRDAMKMDDFKEEMTMVLQSLHSLLNPMELTFDHNTLHQNLLLSNDLRTVRYSASKQGHPEHPERFQTAPQVMCSQGFSGGQHVWVVELGTGMWSVGVCYRSMARRGDQSRLGHNSVSWRLQWKNKKLTACHASSTKALAETRTPLRLEVALDYSKGTLTFNSTDGTREHLYTFRTMFRETVYPAVAIHSTTSESWITLQS